MLEPYDLCIIGGGINGAGIARDAAGRGLKVILLEQNDFASGTSSASSKMIHGGLRYLEFYEFGLVRKSLAEREVLLKIAPQIVKTLKFCIPHVNAPRPAWMVRLGLFLYDHLAKRRSIPGSAMLNLAHTLLGAPLKNPDIQGMMYHDCWVDDARLVILNLLDAERKGAILRNYCKVVSLARADDLWRITTEPQMPPAPEITPEALSQPIPEMIHARAVVNATGPSVQSLLEDFKLLTPTTPRLTLVQGSHIIVPKLYDGDHAYFLQLPDRRVIFVFPYGPYTLCGTTEKPFDGDPRLMPQGVQASEQERAYLCDSLNQFFKRQISPQDIIMDYCGVRPLFQDAHQDIRKISRDYHLEQYSTEPRDTPNLYPPPYPPPLLLSIFGGKITTYRVLAEEVMEKILRPHFPDMGASWTAQTPLPLCPYPLESGKNGDDLSDEELQNIVHYFRTQEWANCVDDILTRRTKWGIFAGPTITEKISRMFDGT